MSNELSLINSLSLNGAISSSRVHFSIDYLSLTIWLAFSINSSFNWGNLFFKLKIILNFSVNNER